jgi:hypothetical protein
MTFNKHHIFPDPLPTSHPDSHSPLPSLACRMEKMGSTFQHAIVLVPYDHLRSQAVLEGITRCTAASSTLMVVYMPAGASFVVKAIDIAHTLFAAGEEEAAWRKQVCVRVSVSVVVKAEDERDVHTLRIFDPLS